MPNPTADQVSAIVNAWFNAKCQCGALARNTDAYNQVFAAIPDLKLRIAALVIPPPSSAPAPVAPAKPTEKE